MAWLCATFLISGLAMAGSDGPLFPIPNIAGGLLLVLAALLSRRVTA